MSEAKPLPTLAVAAALALGSAVSLGLARFSYALLLPPMRADLGWSYFVAGAMNTVNAAGYLAGALAAPSVLRRAGARAVFLAGLFVTALALLGHGLVVDDAALYVLRFVTGVGSAATFVSGGLLAARLISMPPVAPAKAATAARTRRRTTTASAGLVLGIYYGGTGRRHRRLGAARPRARRARGGARVARRVDRPRRARRAGAGDRGRSDATPGRRRGRGRDGWRADALPLAPVRAGARRLPAVRPRLHRLHDVRDLAAARGASRRRGRRRLLRHARCRRRRLVVALGAAAAALARRRRARPAQRAGRHRDRCCRC